MQELLLLQ